MLSARRAIMLPVAILVLLCAITLGGDVDGSRRSRGSITATRRQVNAEVVALIERCEPLLIQQNVGAGGFNRSWTEYKAGFGGDDPERGSYWIGNDLLHQLTSRAGRSFQLRFDIQHRSTGRWFYIEYSAFGVDDEADGYALHIDGAEVNGNTSTDRILFLQDSQKFTTYDRDNDRCGELCLEYFGEGNCAVMTGGGFWYNDCGGVRPNAAGHHDLFMWWGLRGGWALQTSRMWLECP